MRPLLEVICAAAERESNVKEESREKIIDSLCVSSLFGLTLFFFGPTQIYFTNILEFTSSFAGLAPFFAGLSALCVLLLTAGTAFLKSSVHRKAVSLLLALSVLLWIQGNVLLWQYGPMDGREIDWSANRLYGLIDGGVWIAMLIFAYRAAPHIARFARRASAAFLIIQLASALIIAATAVDAAHLHETLVEDEEAIFKFSPERNVVLLVLDQFQGDLYHEIINESLHYRDIVDGATYYRNALAPYPHTFASLAAIMTGRFYENSVPLQEFIKNSFSANSVPRLLKQNGYQVDLIGGGKDIYADETIASNRTEIKHLVEQSTSPKEAALVLDLTFFRYLPHFVKRHVYNNQMWLISSLSPRAAFGDFPAGRHRDTIRFMEKMAREARAASEKPTFKYIHLMVPHMPIRFNERLEYVELANTRENFKEQAKGTLNLVNMFLGRLKYIGVYDSTLIFIIADHGAGGKVEIGLSGYEETDGPESEKIGDPVKGGALPLVLVKPFGATGGLRISDAPVSLADIAKTILSELELDADVPGVSIFDIAESDTRGRRFFDHSWDIGDKQRYEPYLPPLKEYIVTGFSWLDASWQPTHRVFTSEGVKSDTAQTSQ